MSIRVVIADDQQLVRAGFRMILNASKDVEVVGEAGNGTEAIHVVHEQRPDVVLMDIRMPETDGIEATRRITSGMEHPPRILMLTTFDLDEYVYEALRAGASGFLLKEVPPEQLVEGVRTIAAGEALLAPSVTRRMIERFTSGTPHSHATQPPPRELEELTAREREVLDLVARAMSNAEIAAHLVVSEATVKTHITRVFMKLGLRDRAQAVMYAYENGLVRAGASG
jgi:DNA-binding NarL/FixJ family response regulator